MRTKTLSVEDIEKQSKTPQKFMNRIDVKKTREINEVGIFLDEFDQFMKMMSQPPAVWEKRPVHKRNLRKGRNLDPSDPDHLPLMYDSESLKMDKLVKEKSKDNWKCTEAQRKAGVSCFSDKYKITKELEERIDTVANLASERDAKIAKMSRERASPALIKAEKKKWDTKIEKELAKKVDLVKLDDEGKPTPVVKEMLLPAKDKDGNIVNFTTDSGLLDDEGFLVVPVKNRDGSIKKDRLGNPVINRYKPDDRGRFSCTEHQPLQIRIMGPIKPVHAITKAIIDLNEDTAAVPVNQLVDIKELVDKMDTKLNIVESMLNTVTEAAKGSDEQMVNTLRPLFTKKSFSWSGSKDKDRVESIAKKIDKLIENNKGKSDIFKDPNTGITWSITRDELGLSKLFVEKSDRENGAICSDTIRAYFSPEGESDEE